MLRREAESQLTREQMFGDDGLGQREVKGVTGTIVRELNIDADVCLYWDGWYQD